MSPQQFIFTDTVAGADSARAPIPPRELRKVSWDTTFSLQSSIPIPPRPVKSLFTSSRLEARDSSIVPRQKLQPDWVFGIFLACFLMLAWVVVFYNKRLRQVIYGTFSKRFLGQVNREGNLFRERITVALSGVYILTFAMLMYEGNNQVTRLSFPHLEGIVLYAAICALIILYWGGKIVLMNLLSSVFKTQQTNHEYLLNTILFISLTGLILLPIVILLAYLRLDAIFYAGAALMTILFLIRFMKGLFIGITLTKFSYLFLFVYLCGLELLPLAIVMKLVISFSELAK